MRRSADDSTHAEEFRSGFVSVVGRPNVGKSTLVNSIVDSKVSIVSDKPQTTRTTVKGVHTTDDFQIVFLDTPGIHRPRTRLGERLNRHALGTLGEVDVVCFMVEANAAVGPGDRFIAEHVATVRSPTVLVLNKVDLATPSEIAAQLDAASQLADFDAYVPVCARSGDGASELLTELVPRLPRGPRYYPEGTVTDQPEAFVIGEILREKLLEVTRDELPHSIAVTVEEIEERDHGVLAVRAVVLVERDSQKGIVIGSGGDMIKRVGSRARHELEALFGTRVYLETRVKVEKDWQRREHALDRLGY